MSPMVYNTALLIGIALVGTGVNITYGRGPCMTVVGALVLVATLLGAAFGRRG